MFIYLYTVIFMIDIYLPTLYPSLTRPRLVDRQAKPPPLMMMFEAETEAVADDESNIFTIAMKMCF